MTIQNFMQLTQKTALLSYSLSNLLTEADSSKAPTFEESSCNPTASGPTGRIYTLGMQTYIKQEKAHTTPLSYCITRTVCISFY